MEKFTDSRWRIQASALNDAGEALRQAAYRKWRWLLNLPLVYSTLPDNDREALTWNSLVTILQVVGRLVRGGSAARVFFCDKAFKPRTAMHNRQLDDARSSLLVSFKQVLHPYFDDTSPVSRHDRELVRTLYEPFYDALERMS